MPIYRLAPGEAAPLPGMYALVDHWGTPLGYTGWFEKGDRLPLVTATTELTWYVLVDASIDNAQAA
jgi:hypothetical protein